MLLQIKKRSRKRTSAQGDAYEQVEEVSLKGVERRKNLAEATEDVLDKLNEALFGNWDEDMTENE